ncbi:hypothetical protein FRAHR75_480045 [Frankia sp. Hr75.2]|nr:hypothetical protein FRAHR75_480045 [Frankia sp. Hr75.2]
MFQPEAATAPAVLAASAANSQPELIRRRHPVARRRRPPRPSRRTGRRPARCAPKVKCREGHPCGGAEK